MKRALATVVVLLVLGAAAPSTADKGDEISPNLRRVRSITPDGGEKSDPWDIAFQGNLLAAAMYEPPASPLASDPTPGVGLFRIRDRRPFLKQLSFYRCDGWRQPGLWRRWLFQPVYGGDTTDEAQGRNDNTFTSSTCNSTDLSTGAVGMRVVDISDPHRPKQVDFVETPCGVGHFALYPYRTKVYVISNSGCSDSAENPAFNGAYGDVEILVFDPRRPRATRLAGRPEILPMSGCLDVAVYLPRQLMACTNTNHFGLFDMSDPPNPVMLGDSPTVLSESASLRSSAFTYDGQYLAILDTAEIYTTDANRSCSGGDEGQGPLVRFFNIEDPAVPEFVSAWRLSRNPCMPISIQMLPSMRRYLVSVTYGASGFEVIDFSSPERPRSIAHYRPDSPAASPTDAVDEDYPTREIFAAYWFNGLLYSTEHISGRRAGQIDVFRALSGLSSRPMRTQARFNPRTQGTLR